MADDKIWVSRAMMDPRLIKGFSSDVFEADKERALDAMRRNKRGEPLPAERFPRELFSDDWAKPVRKVPELCMCNGFWVVSARCAEVLRRFDLGRGGLYPTKLYEFDRVTPIEGEHYCLNFGETKSAFVPERSSPTYKRPKAGGVYWTLNLSPRDDDIAVRASALEGPELSMDPDLWHAFIVSGRLADAIKAAKLGRVFSLFECQVLRDN